MARPRKILAGITAGMPPLRDFWREINRDEKQDDVDRRAQRKAKDKKRAKCRCDAYRFPHRPGGGLCRYPDPPAVRWQDAQTAEIAERVSQFKRMWGEPDAAQMADLIAMTAKLYRPYRKRYAGIVRQIARANGLHPIRDRAEIEKRMSWILILAKELHQKYPKYKYRNMEITERGITGHWTTAGPTM